MSSAESQPRPPLRGSDVLVGLLVDDPPRFRAQAIRLLRSIRWFGGELAASRVVVGVVDGVDGVPRAFADACEELGGEIRVVPRFPVPNGSANRLQMFRAVEDSDVELLLLLDCDTLVLRDPLPLLRTEVVQAKITPAPSVTMPALARAFAHFGVPLPEPAYVHRYTGEPTISYCNAGVVAAPPRLLRQLEPVWRFYNVELMARLELIHPCERHVHQASMALALAASGVPFQEMPEELNFQLMQDWLPSTPPFLDLDPAILHYHERVDGEGCLLPCPYPLAQRRIEAFNERHRALERRR